MKSNTEDRLSRYRAKRIRFFINGDKYFRGINYALTEKTRSFEYLLNELNRLLNEHSIALIKGVRYIFTLKGDIIKSLLDFQEGQAYVCSSIDKFVQTDYPTTLSGGMLNWLVRNSACISSRRGLNQVSKSSHTLPNSRLSSAKHILDNSINRQPSPSKSPNARLRQTPPSTTNQNAFKQLSNSCEPNTISHRNDTINNNKSSESNGSAKRRINNSRRMISIDTPNAKIRDVASKLNGICIESTGKHDNNLQAISQTKQASQNNATQKQSSNSTQVTRNSPKKDTIVSNDTNHVNRFLSHQPKTKPQQLQKNGYANQANLKEESQYQTDAEHPADVVDKYDVGRPIGDGHFSIVYCCMNKSSQQFCALKLIDKLKCRGKDDMIYNEVKILKRLQHPNIVKLIEEFDFPKQLYLILELVQDGDLFDAITTVTKFDEVDVATMIHNLSSALTYLHLQNIVHRDIKPENLLIYVQEDGSQSLKLADFGLAIEMGEEPLYNVCGTAFYVSPEMLNETGYSFKVDVWSTGVICYILLCGYPPFTSENESNQDELFDAILAGDFQFSPPYWSNVSNHAKSLIRSMLTVDPEQRYTAERVFNHPWTRGESSNFEAINPLNLSRLTALKRSL